VTPLVQQEAVALPPALILTARVARRRRLIRPSPSGGARGRGRVGIVEDVAAQRAADAGGVLLDGAALPRSRRSRSRATRSNVSRR